MSSELLIVAGVTLLSMVAIHYIQWIQEDKKLPPGPRRLPLLGNLLQVPVLRPYPKFREWAKEYGPVFSLRLGPQTVVVLNSPEAAHEILDNRARIYSSRAPPHVAHDIMSDGQRLVFLPYDKEWKAAKKTLQPLFTTSKTREMRTTQELESRVVMFDLLNHGEQSFVPEFRNVGDEVPERHWFAIIRRYTTSVVMLATYGNRVNRVTNNPHLHKIYDVLANFAHVGQPGNYLADAFPILRKLPDILAPWRIAGRRMHEWEMELWGGLLERCKEEIRQGKEHVTNYVVTYLRQRMDAGIDEAPGKGVLPNGHLTDKLLAYCAGTVLEAGSDTTASTMQSFFLFMISHPHILKKLREEIDRVIGDERMPGFEDEGTLPYLVACIKETLRRRPPTIMGIPHSSDESDCYEGYLIPKNSTVIGNVWAIHMDPVTYPNPFAFNPDRFMEKENNGTWGSGPDYKGRDHFVFGWGRRFCVGQNIAEASLFLVLSRIIWAFDLQVPKDPKTGNPIIPDINDEDATYTDGFVSVPKAYPLAFIPRSEKKAQIVRKAFEQAQEEWEYLGLDTDDRSA
ncbi:cytochrome p450 [Moniliophthora roreri MCA 2997]|uniref:Cytochrome p450 n=2 Tax=Moniliophthora roreri TaxID=221103 RepID=V2YXL5_MONRO|nr:cytochrome p450 [Moniliophthora roreri MCA 2997]KAI3619701.1 cytochrome p450 [Moniliophthora roreri]